MYLSTEDDWEQLMCRSPIHQLDRRDQSKILRYLHHHLVIMEKTGVLPRSEWDEHVLWSEDAHKREIDLKEVRFLTVFPTDSPKGIRSLGRRYLRLRLIIFEGTYDEWLAFCPPNAAPHWVAVSCHDRPMARVDELHKFDVCKLAVELATCGGWEPAVRILESIAQESSCACYNLGYIAEKGFGGRIPDQIAAVRWYQKALELGPDLYAKMRLKYLTGL